jgi:antitoxin component YwqK of YwqJK toxin-antitoxin module
MKYIIGLLLILLGGLACQHEQAKPPDIRMENRDSLLHKTDRGWVYGERPFSGYMVEKEANGRIVYELPIILSKEEGMAKGWYNSGEKLVERFYENGKKEGISKQWWPNGKLRYLFQYQNDAFDGKQLVFFPSGKKREESNYQLGEREGVQRVWDEKGNLISNYTLKNKRLYGVISVKSCIPSGH